ncbi:MAG: type IV conjugative transfer system protein TraL [Hyphomicrobiales bacterium]
MRYRTILGARAFPYSKAELTLGLPARALLSFWSACFTVHDSVHNPKRIFVSCLGPKRMNAIRIPHRIDEPRRLLLCKRRGAGPDDAGGGPGIIVDHPTIRFPAGLVVSSLYKRFRESRPDGYLLHPLCWSGFSPARGRSFPNPFIRRYFP